MGSGLREIRGKGTGRARAVPMRDCGSLRAGRAVGALANLEASSRRKSCINVIEYQPQPVAAISQHQLNPRALLQLRALDEMERLALPQVAAARQRKREILSKHGIPAASRTAGRILVMRSEERRVGKECRSRRSPDH